MGRSKTSGITTDLEGHKIINKRFLGQHLYKRLGPISQAEAEQILARWIEQTRKAILYGERSRRTFREAAVKFLRENTHLATIDDRAQHVRDLDPFIGDLALNQVHDQTLAPYVDARRRQGASNRRINIGLACVRRILNLAARSWRDEHGLTWLETPPLISMLDDVTGRRQPYPLSWEEQALLFSELALHLARMALFKVNTGTREQEVCQLRWAWERGIPELNETVFIVPGPRVKNREPRLIVLNAVARSVVEALRGEHREFVFTYRGHAVEEINNTGWIRARKRAAARYPEVIGGEAPEGFRRIRVHDLKHTFGRRLRAAGVPLETRKVLLGHKSSDITTHYSAPEIAELIAAANRIDAGRTSPVLAALRA